MNKSHIKLQFQRLKRHYQLAKDNKDPIAFLDLAHSLRIWAEMKEVVDQIANEEHFIFELPNKVNNKRLKNILKGSNYFDIPLASVEDNFTPDVQVKGVQFVNRPLTPEEIKKIFEMGPPKIDIKLLSFSQWLGSEVISTSNPQDGRYVGITREIMIKRTANLLGASHPEGEDSENELENKFDPYVKELNKIQVANGYPLTHYQLIEIAQDILKSLKNLFES